MTACVKCGHDPAAMVGAKWVLELDKRVTTANLRTVNAGASRWRYAKERDEWGILVLAEIRKRGMALAGPDSRRRVTIKRLYAGRCQEIDRDNLLGGVKPLVDALARRLVIYDDDADHIELHATQERSLENRTIVLVEELTDGAKRSVNTLPAELVPDALAIHMQRKPRC